MNTIKKMKSAAKISVGFGLGMAIASALGGAAVCGMNAVAGKTTKLATEYVPEVAIASDIRGAANRVMYNMRGYGFTENDAFYKQALVELELLKKGLAKGDKLAHEAIYLKKLKGALAKIKTATGLYQTAVEETHATVDEMKRHRAALDKNAAAFISNNNAFLEGQNQAFKRDLAERQKKIQIVSELVSLGTKVRVMNFKAQATNDAALLKSAIAELGKAKALTDAIGSITRRADDIKRIDAIVAAAQGYGTAMTSFLAEFRKGPVANSAVLAEFRKAMDKHAGTYVQNCGDFLAGQQANLTKDMTERHAKLTLANDIIDLGNTIRIMAFKSQALRDPKLMLAAKKNFAKIAEKMVELRKITRLKEDLERIDQVEAAANGYEKAMTAFLGGWGKLQLLGKQRDTQGRAMIAACATLATAGISATTSISTGAMHALNLASLIMVVGLAAALVIGILLALFITRSITKPINIVVEGLDEGARQVASASTQISSSSQSLAEGAAQQAASLEETSASVEEMASMTKQNSDSAQQANSLMDEAGKIVGEANASMKKLKAAMDKITSASEETGKIIKTIDEIAFQTNLLALNAAVEAARAGEAGAGFAVVADEVRNLAMRAAEAAKNTQELIEGNIKNISEGSALVNNTDQVLDRVEESAGKVAELVGEIAAASQEQTAGIEQINTAAGEMDTVTQQVAANAEESAAASEELSAQAQTMQGMVGDLRSLVEGNKAATDGPGDVKRIESPKKKIGRKLLLGPAKKQDPALMAENPEDQIPMGDDFQDF